MNKKLGIIGGMGPLASAYLSKRIIELTYALKDQDHIPMVIDNNTKILDRTAYLTGRGEDPYPSIKESALFLEKSKVDAIIIACNTAHFCYNRLKDDVAIPIYNMIDEVVLEINKNSRLKQNIAILGTEGLRFFPNYKAKLNKEGISAYELNEDEQTVISKVIYLIKESGINKEVLDIFNKLINDLEAKGLKRFILGCTELATLEEHLTEKEKYINSIDIIAKHTIKRLGYSLKGEKA